MTLKEILEGKCTDPSKWIDYAYYLQVRTANWGSVGYGATANPEWWIREALREQQGVYAKPTAIITALRNLYPDTFLHISKEDPLMVAYTPDDASGKADRQVKTTLGRYLTKYFLRMPENIAKQVVHDHLAEADPTIEYLTGEDIVEVYKSGAFSSCMSSTAKVWEGLPEKTHPASAYIADGIKLAVLRDADGKVVERALVVTKPDGTLGYIRAYGQKLLKKLTRNNIAATGWNGVKFNTLLFNNTMEWIKEPVMGVDYSVVMPYLDCNGSAGSSNGSCIALIDGRVQGVTTEEYNALRSEYGSDAAVIATNTSGYQVLTNVPATSLYGTCALTGAAFKKANTREWVWYVNAAGEQMRIATTAEVETVEAHILVNGIRVRAKVDPSLPRFEHAYSTYLDTPALRALCNMVKLDSGKYPDRASEWVAKDTTITIDEDGQNCVVLASDAVAVLRNVEGVVSLQYVWKPTRKYLKDYVKLYPRHRGDKLYAAKDVKVQTTLSGKVVCGDYHAITTVGRNPGTVEFTKKVVTTRYLGKTLYILRSAGGISQLQENFMIGQWLDDYMEDACDTESCEGIDDLVERTLEYAVNTAGLRRAIYRLIERVGTYTYSNSYSYSYPSMDTLDLDAIAEGRYFANHPAVKEWLAKWMQLVTAAEVLGASRRAEAAAQAVDEPVEAQPLTATATTYSYPTTMVALTASTSITTF